MGRMSSLALILGMTTLAACHSREPSADAFSRTGQLIAMSGGEAGAANACFTCHGLEGEGLGEAPRLAGLPSGYLLKQLQDYADGRRADPIMHAIARRLSMEDRRAVAEWYGDKPSPTFAFSSAEAVGGREIYHRSTPVGSCAACHGNDGEGQGAAVPPLAGQPPAYLARQLRLWQDGKRQNDPDHVMLRAIDGLDDDQIEAVANYAASLPGDGAAADSETAPSPPGSRRHSRNGASAPPPRAAGSSPAG